MEEVIDTCVASDEVWRSWERAHAASGRKRLEKGQKGKKTFHYKVLDVQEGESFSILWKTLFVRLIFTHTVQPKPYGSRIIYGVQIKGPFAWPVRWFLGDKIRKNIRYVLQAIVRELEEKCIKDADCRSRPKRVSR